MQVNVSVIVPCYNQATYLDECLQSVLDQTYKDWECIIVDDGSTDDSAKIIEKWVVKDSRFISVFKENGGVASARNLGIRNAVGDWILPLDGDDFIAPEYMDKASQNFSDDVLIIYPECRRFGDREGIWELSSYRLQDFLLNNSIVNSCFFKKEDALATQLYDENMDGFEDWEFLIQLVEKHRDKKILKLDYPGLNYRVSVSSRNISLKTTNKDQLAFRYIVDKHLDLYLEFYPYQAILSDNKVLKEELTEQQSWVRYYRRSRIHKLADAVIKYYYRITTIK